MEYWFLAGAVGFEVVATLSLRKAARGAPTWFVPVVIGYLVAFSLLAGALARGLGLGVAYGIWAAAGVAVTAVATKFLFQEPFTKIMSAGIAVIIAGVMVIELGATH